MTYLSTKQVAEEIGVHRDTLLRWLRSGKIPEPPRDGHGWRRFREQDLTQLKKITSEPGAFVKNTDDNSISTTAAQLEKLDWDFAQSKTGYLTHNIHPYPAKFIPQIPNQLIQELSSVGDTVLDPFCGSGTTLLEALLLRRNAVGIDANPLACLIARAKTAYLSEKDFTELEALIADARQMQIQLQTDQPTLFAEDKVNWFSSHSSLFDSKDIDFWFPSHVQQELAWIKTKLNTINSANARDVAETMFSAIIVAVSHQDSDTRYTRREKNIRGGETLARFADHLARQIPHLRELAELIQPECTREIICSDILETPPIPKAKLIVTSPPYPNAYSYHLYHRTRMLWLGMDQPLFKKQEIGSHRKYSSKSANAPNVETFRSELQTIVRWLIENLEDNGHICFVLGNSKIRGEVIQNDLLFIQVAENHGLKLVSNVKRELQLTKKSFNPAIGRIKYENIIVLKKT